MHPLERMAKAMYDRHARVPEGRPGPPPWENASPPLRRYIFEKAIAAAVVLRDNPPAQLATITRDDAAPMRWLYSLNAVLDGLDTDDGAARLTAMINNTTSAIEGRLL